MLRQSSNIIRYDYSDINIGESKTSTRLKNKLIELSDTSMKRRIQSESKIKIAQLIFTDLKETQKLIKENLVEKVLRNKTTVPKPLIASKLRKLKKECSESDEDQKLGKGLFQEKVRSAMNKFMANKLEDIDEKSHKTKDSMPKERIKFHQNHDNDTNEHNRERENSFYAIKRRQSKLTMDVDKWIDVHRRPSRRISSAQLVNGTNFARKDSKSANPELLKHIETDKKGEDNKLSKEKGDAFEDTDYLEESRLFGINVGRSRRELRDLTVLDIVKKKNREAMEEQAKMERRLLRQHEFNGIVEKIRTFLEGVEQFTNKEEHVNNKMDKYNITPAKRLSIKLWNYQF